MRVSEDPETLSLDPSRTANPIYCPEIIGPCNRLTTPVLEDNSNDPQTPLFSFLSGLLHLSWTGLEQTCPCVVSIVPWLLVLYPFEARIADCAVTHSLS